MSLLLCLALTCGTLTVRQLDGRIAERQAELARTRRDLEDLRQRLTGLSRAESTSLGRLEDLREEISVARRFITQLSGQVEARTAEVAEATRAIEQASARLEARKAELNRRLVTLYKYGRLLPLQAVLDAGSPGRLYRRVFYLRWLARTDRRLAGELAALKSELAARRAEQVNARAELERVREERVREERRLETARQSEDALLRRLRSEQAAQQKVAGELAASVERLQELIRTLEQQRDELQQPDENHHFTLNKGGLPWPARGEIVAGYGTRVHPRYRTTTANRGVDIDTRPGTAAAAIHDGKVVYADQFLGYGRLVILDHNGGFYTLYGNLDEISVTVGSELVAGATVGKTRDYLHFELRRGGQPVDPLQWLQP